MHPHHTKAKLEWHIETITNGRQQEPILQSTASCLAHESKAQSNKKNQTTSLLHLHHSCRPTRTRWYSRRRPLDLRRRRRGRGRGSGSRNVNQCRVGCRVSPGSRRGNRKQRGIRWAPGAGSSSCNGTGGCGWGDGDGQLHSVAAVAKSVAEEVAGAGRGEGDSGVAAGVAFDGGVGGATLVVVLCHLAQAVHPNIY